MTAAVLAYGVNLMLWIMDQLYSSVSVEWLSEIMKFASVYRRNGNMIRLGQLSFASILFDLSFIAAFLALTVWKLDRRRYGK